MKSGTNSIKGSGYAYFRDPDLNSRTDPTLVVAPGTTPLRGSKLRMYGGTVGGPIRTNKIFSFTSFEQWDDTRPLSIIRTVPTELERQGNFSQSTTAGGVVRTIFNPFTSTIDPATGRVVRTPFAGNAIPSAMFDPVAVKMLAGAVGGGNYHGLADFHQKSLFLGMMHFQDPYNWDIDRIHKCDIHYATPDPECDLDYTPNVARERTIRAGLSNSFGFGGTNACLVLRAV